MATWLPNPIPTTAFALLYLCLGAQALTMPSDIEALRAIKHAIDPNSIAPSSFINSWDFESDPCESSGGRFLGLLCTVPLDNSTSRVTAITLIRDGYDGFLSDEIGNLTQLTALDLSRNNFRGPIPDSVSNLQKLTQLSLAENSFTGVIPPVLSSLRMLETLDLYQNRFSGSIPSYITGFRRLTYLRLSNNGFSGIIPDLTPLWQLTALDMGTNQLNGNLPDLPKTLVTLSLNHNILSGSISSIQTLKRLQTLDLSDNRFSGVIDEDIFSLPEMVTLNVSWNRFTTMRVAGLTGRETRLQTLEAQRNSLQGHLPFNLVTASELTSINLAYNQFSGSIPREYGAKIGKPWRKVFLDHNFLTGTLPNEFSGNSKVRIRGSVAENCLKCPAAAMLCRGRQRAASMCIGQKGGRFPLI